MGGSTPSPLLTLYDVAHEARVSFPAPPDYIWDALTRTDLFENWWAWIRDVELEGDALTKGSSISFTIDPPTPYRMKISVLVVESDRERFLRGKVTGDLDGEATFELTGDDVSSEVRIAWDLHIRSPLIRPVIFIARPILLRAQSWAVEIALRGFRRYLREQGFEA